MRIRFRNGIEIDCGDRLLLDPVRTLRDVPSLVSHAHSDHVPKDIGHPSGRVLATEGTAALIERRYGDGTVEVIHYNEGIELGPFEVYAFPAGHIYGSAGFLINCGGKTVFYTGDVNPLGGLTVESPARIPSSDVLIVESTYGHPRYRFPDPYKVRTDIAKWVAEEVSSGRSPVIEAYLVGKSQEVIALLNKYTNVEVVVSERVAEVSEPLKERFGLQYTTSPEGPHVLVTHRARTNGKARVTGWALFSKRREDFPLSAHADFDGLVSIVMGTNPERVLTVYGFSEEFARWLKKWGIDAQPLGGEWVEL